MKGMKQIQMIIATCLHITLSHPIVSGSIPFLCVLVTCNLICPPQSYRASLSTIDQANHIGADNYSPKLSLLETIPGFP